MPGVRNSAVLDRVKLRDRHQIAMSTEPWPDRDPELLIDLIYGPIYYRLLVGHQPLDTCFGDALVDSVLSFSAERGGGRTTV